jgi:hypothetical protein
MWITKMAKHVSVGPKEEISERKLGWYKFSQNNSGGSHHSDEDVAQYVFIQAYSAKEANRLAENIGIYFDGSLWGRDCDCCGDRWEPAYERETDLILYSWASGKGYESKVYDNAFDYFSALADEDMFAEKGKPSVIAYYSDGSKNIFYKE